MKSIWPELQCKRPVNPVSMTEAVMDGQSAGARSSRHGCGHGVAARTARVDTDRARGRWPWRSRSGLALYPGRYGKHRTRQGGVPRARHHAPIRASRHPLGVSRLRVADVSTSGTEDWPRHHPRKGCRTLDAGQRGAGNGIASLAQPAFTDVDGEHRLRHTFPPTKEGMARHEAIEGSPQ